MVGVASIFSDKVKFPQLEEILGYKANNVQTPDQMEAQVQSLAIAFGAKITIIDEG